MSDLTDDRHIVQCPCGFRWRIDPRVVQPFMDMNGIYVTHCVTCMRKVQIDKRSWDMAQGAKCKKKNLPS